MFLARVLRRCRTIRPKRRKEVPLALTEALRGTDYNEHETVLLQDLNDVAHITPNFSVTGQQLWNSSKLIRENQHFRRSYGACVVGGAAVIRHIWRDFMVRPNVVYVPDTEPTLPTWCLEEGLSTCIVRCPPVEIKKKLLSAEWADAYAAEFPIPTQPSLEMFLGEGKPARITSMLVLMGLRIPSNVGVLIRAAVDMGYEAVLLENCVDLFNEKLLRASGGAVFSPKIKIFETNGTSLSILNTIALDHQLLPLLAVPDQNAEHAFTVAKHFHAVNAMRRQHQNVDGESTENYLGPLLILGSESRGLESLVGEWRLPHRFVSVALPNPAVDSINVSVAGSVLLYAFRPAAEKSFAAAAHLGPEELVSKTPSFSLTKKGALDL